MRPIAEASFAARSLGSGKAVNNIIVIAPICCSGSAIAWEHRWVLESEPVTITLDDANSVSGILKSPPEAKACFVFAHGAGAGMTHPFMAAHRERTCGTRHRDLALSVSLHGKGKQASRPAQARSCDRARRCGQGVAVAAQLAAYRRRQIIWRPDDISGAGAGASSKCARPGIPRISAASGRPPLSRARAASFRYPHPYAVSARDARCSGRYAAPGAALRGARPARGAEAVFDADHSFHVPARSGRTDVQVRSQLLDAMAEWIDIMISALRI